MNILPLWWLSWHHDDHHGIMMIILVWHLLIITQWKDDKFLKSITLMAFNVAKPQQSAKPNCYRYVITLLPSNSQTVSRHSTPLPLLPSWMLSELFCHLVFYHCLWLPEEAYFWILIFILQLCEHFHVYRHLIKQLFYLCREILLYTLFPRLESFCA